SGHVVGRIGPGERHSDQPHGKRGNDLVDAGAMPRLETFARKLEMQERLQLDRKAVLEIEGFEMIVEVAKRQFRQLQKWHRARQRDLLDVRKPVALDGQQRDRMPVRRLGCRKWQKRSAVADVLRANALCLMQVS